MAREQWKTLSESYQIVLSQRHALQTAAKLAAKNKEKICVSDRKLFHARFDKDRQ
ncbi:MAG: hypothetical protein WCQ91_04775 [Planctomycetota bacterium]